MKKIFKKIYTFFVKPYIKWKISKDQWIDYQGIRLLVKNGVFHPLYFYSTKFLIEFLEKEDLKNKKILELGAGSGLISFYCESKYNAIVTASDISDFAIDGLHFNRKTLGSKIEIIHSNLFDKIPKQVFDFVIINPPYYKKRPIKTEELAWFCGEEMEYFLVFFKEICNFIDEKSKILMILSEDCDLDEIINIANKNEFQFELIETKKMYFEENYIFEIYKI